MTGFTRSIALDLARALDRRASALGRPVDALVEVNLAGESQKGGVRPDDLERFLAELSACSALRVGGLMAIPPAAEDPERTRPYFRRLRALRDKVGLRHLSMGMSADYEVAIEEGATMVRVGTAVFGARPAVASADAGAAAPSGGPAR